MCQFTIFPVAMPIPEITDMPNYRKTRRRLAGSREFRLNARSGACDADWYLRLKMGKHLAKKIYYMEYAAYEK